MDTHEMAKLARWPYRVVIKMDGDAMGDPRGIPCRTKEQADNMAAGYNKRSPRITAEVLPA